MDYVVMSLIIVLIINKCDAGVSTKDNPLVILTRFSSSTIEQAANYTLLMNKPVYIHFQYMSITRGWCFNNCVHGKYLDDGVQPLLTIPNTIQVNVTSNESTVWKCNVTENMYELYPGRGHNKFRLKYYVFYLNVHVRGAKSVEMTINDKKITFTEAELSVPYDGHSLYSYENAEHVQIVCRNPQKTGSVCLEYFGKGFSSASKTARHDIQLHSGSDHSYIDCVYINDEPADRFVYRVTFAKTPSFYSNESITRTAVTASANEDTDSKSSPLLLISSIGAVLVLLAVSVVAVCFIRTKNTKLIETPYGDLSNKSDISTSQHKKESKNQDDLCPKSDRLSDCYTYYNTAEGVENIDPKYHHYTEIDYISCKPKIGETQIRNSRVYDEPYVQITRSDTMQTLKRV